MKAAGVGITWCLAPGADQCQFSYRAPVMDQVIVAVGNLPVQELKFDPAKQIDPRAGSSFDDEPGVDQSSA